MYIKYIDIAAHRFCFPFGRPILGGHAHGYNTTILAYRPEDLSTLGCNGTVADTYTRINYTQLAHPLENKAIAGCHFLYGQDDPLSQTQQPRLSVPGDLSLLDPLWAKYNCTVDDLGVLDPPRTLEPGGDMVV